MKCPWKSHEIRAGTDLNVSDVLGIHLRPGNHLQDEATKRQPRAGRGMGNGVFIWMWVKMEDLGDHRC